MENPEERPKTKISKEKTTIEVLEQKLKTLEARILEQEHRPFKIIANFVNRKKKWKDKNDKRRSAVKKAVLWRLLISPTVIAIATGGLLGYFSLFFMWKQTRLFENQNELFKLQNIRIEQQTHLIEADRRSAQMFIMGEVLSDINRELEDPENTKRLLSNTLTGRIISLSRAMKPYRYLENDTLSEPLSPERGQLLVSLVESNMDSIFFVNEILAKCDFNKADLREVNFRDANLGKVDLRGANLRGANLTGANLSKAKLFKANLSRVKLYKANLTGTYLKNANLTEAYLPDTDLVKVNLRGADLTHANLMSADLSHTNLIDTNLSGQT